MACRTAAATLAASSASDIGISVGYKVWRVSQGPLNYEDKSELTVKSSSSFLPFFFLLPLSPRASTSSVIPSAIK